MAMQSHLIFRTLGKERPYSDVKAMLSTNPNRKALLFIHGYSGDAINTWSEFHELLPECPKCESRDMYFYGYDGLRADLLASAAIFREFLNKLFNSIGTVLEETLPISARRQANFGYDELVIVAHSLGAVIARRALVDATKIGLPWAKKIKLVLYAPAHIGARVVDLALEAASSFRFVGLFGFGVRFQSPLIDQLRPGSQSLSQLLEDTRLAIRDGANEHLIARMVVIAEYERIVSNQTFCNDPAPIAIPDTDHISVCKPTRKSRRALALLEDCL